MEKWANLLSKSNTGMHLGLHPIQLICYITLCLRDILLLKINILRNMINTRFPCDKMAGTDEENIGILCCLWMGTDHGIHSSTQSVCQSVCWHFWVSSSVVASCSAEQPLLPMTYKRCVNIPVIVRLWKGDHWVELLKFKGDGGLRGPQGKSQ